MNRFDQKVTVNGAKILLTNETRFVGPIAVQRYRIISTNLWIYRAVEPRTTHKSICTIDRSDGKCEHFGRRYDWFGDIGSQELPAEIDALPVGEARYAACVAWRKSESERARIAIEAAFPETALAANRCGCEVELYADA